MANLPKSVISTIKATAPAVGAHATEITGCFYPKLFKNDPETLRYFNKTNQGCREGYKLSMVDVGHC